MILEWEWYLLGACTKDKKYVKVISEKKRMEILYL